jgi:hypothetical protein
VRAEALLLGDRRVRSPGGAEEVRPMIETEAVLGEVRWPIELTLTARTGMEFRMLLGRSAIRGRFLVNPGRSFLAGRRDG